MQNNEPVPTDLLKSFVMPEARVKFGRALRTLASSCMDISDGVLLDLSRLLNASKVGAKIHMELLPLSDTLLSRTLENSFEFATSGDDYELLFTVPANKLTELYALENEFSFPLTEIGVITESGELETRLNGKPYEADSQGYQHFG